MTAAAGRFNWRFGIRIFVTIAFVAFNATSFTRLALAVRDTVVSVLYAKAAAFLRCVRVIRPLVTSEALQHLFHLGVLIRVVTVLTALGIFRFRVIPVVKIFDDAPLGMLSPL